jgi:hypothetical protein
LFGGVEVCEEKKKDVDGGKWILREGRWIIGRRKRWKCNKERYLCKREKRSLNFERMFKKKEGKEMWRVMEDWVGREGFFEKMELKRWKKGEKLGIMWEVKKSEGKEGCRKERKEENGKVWKWKIGFW